MDFLSPLIAQVRELFASMTPGARLTAGLLLAVVVVSLGFLFGQASSGPDEYLFGGDPIGRGRLPRIEGVLGKADIDYEVDGTRIKVGRSQRNAAIAAIADAGELPPEFHSLMEEGLNGGGMFEPRELKIQRLRAMREAQASLILSEFPWVEKARVIHNVRNERGMQAGRHATAAVSIMPAAGERFTNARQRTVKDFITKALDVPIEQVVVTNLGGDLAMGEGEIQPEDYEHPRFRLKAMVQRDVTANILEQLSYITGVRVKVNAKIDPVSEQRVVQVTPESEPVTLAQTKSDSSNEQTVNHNGDRVGAVANGPDGVPRDDALARTDSTVQRTKHAESMAAVGSKKTETVTSGFELREVDASVAVPLSYVEAVYRRENLDADGNEPTDIDPALFDTVQSAVLTQIEEIVQPLLPRLSLGENKYRQVNVRFFRDLPKDPIPEPSMAVTAMGFLATHGNTLAMAGLAMFSLVMLRSMVSGGGGGDSKDGAVQGLPSLKLDGEDLADAGPEEEDEHHRPKLKLRKADTLKDDLSEMVSSDPDAAAAILRAWINNNSAGSNNAA